MKRVALALFTGIVLAVSCGLTFAEEEMPFVKNRHEWAKFGEGTWVKIRATMKVIIPGVDTPPQKTTIKKTLKEVTEDKLTLQIEEETMGIKEKTEETIPLDPGSDPHTKWEKKGTEDIEAAGKTFTCEVWILTEKKEGAESVSTLWINEDVQGSVVKITTKVKAEDEEMTMEMILVKQGETIKVKDKELKCDVMKGTVVMPMGRQEVTEYYCEEVPGFMVKGVMKGKTDDGMDIEMVTKVVDYEVK